MLRFLLRRLIVAVAVALTVSVITFTLSHVAVDPALAVAPDSATDADIAAIRRQFGFDRPLPVQYLDYLGDIVTLDLGVSYLTGEPVAAMIAERVPTTALLALFSILFALAIAIPLGVLAACFPNTIVDRFCLMLAVAGQAIPNFWAGLILILVFGVQLRWLPISGSDTLAHFVLPTIALGTFAMPALMRLTRAGMLDVLAADYIRTARAMGLASPAILFRWGLTNALLPVISLTAVQFGFMLGGSIIIESVFAIHGVGYLAWQSFSRSDMPVIQAIVLMVSLAYIVLTLLADLVNAWMDPRIRSVA
ncbi:ABC transporter permease [Acuticoccus sp. I52.16.1]|uniref:ABC transporter permease n=1 Tax=Acuticoccus sp. I52.16.1 TaxID=2928472 RepID=UPI001FD33E02|nr:ABC transporter permease [Acuticoccus sp. I52.16.1]UOM35623.1 ABC transporter permease [Acuticoccus sp. I52.16.1]